MSKILVVARAEFFIAVTSKAFIIGLVMMPVFMLGALAIQHLIGDQTDITPRRIAIVDETNRLYDAIETRASERNQFAIFSQEEGEERKQIQPEFLIEKAEPDPNNEQRLDVQLAKRVKDDDLFAYVFIDKGLFDTTERNSPPATGGDSQASIIRYHSQSPSYQRLPNWLSNVINGEVKQSQATALGLSQQDVASLSRDARLQMFGLVSLDADGNIADAKEESRALTFIVPFAGLMLMFMMVMSVAPTMLNNVLEEKMQKISEFLVSSVTPFQLMLGKLVGAVAIGLTLSVIYVGAAYGLSVYFEIADRIPLSLYAWFFFFLFIALVIFGSVFSAIGAACSEIKDAQSLMAPVMMLVVLPMLCIGPVLDSPSSTFATAVSLFPPATPMLMFARIAIQPGPALWEIMLAVVLSILFAIACVWSAGKVFRIGMLSQGQAPSLMQIARWIIAKA